jgi:hypothetical protein
MIAAALLLSGCGTGVDAPTDNQPPSGDGASVTTNALAARGLLLVVGTDPGTATLAGTVVNTGITDDAITGISLAGSTPKVTMTDGGQTATSIALPRRSRVQFGYDPATHIDLTGLTTPAGSFVPVTITYATAGTATVDVLTVLPVGNYVGMGPLPATAPAPSASASASAPSPSASA